MKLKVLSLLATTLLSAPIATSAAVVITIERTSDQEALITASGFLNFLAPPDQRNVLALVDPFASDPPTATLVDVLTASSMTVGGIPVDFAVERGGSMAPVIAFGSIATDFAPFGVFAGTLHVMLQGSSTLLDVGSTGPVFWGSLDLDYLQGNWRIVSPSAAPEPGTAALLAVGLVGLAATRKRKQQSGNA
jgi:hypothetical protein